VGIKDINSLSIGEFLTHGNAKLLSTWQPFSQIRFPALASQIKSAIEEIERKQGYHLLAERSVRHRVNLQSSIAL
jgi:hypothetical protein